jgi:hypothetical protein
MKTLHEYILESLIFEKKSVADLAEEKATEIIKIVTSDNKDKFKASDDERNILKDISDKKTQKIDKFYSDKSNIFKITISFKGNKRHPRQNYDLFIIINCYKEEYINGKLNTFDFCKSENGKLVFYIVLNCIDDIYNIRQQKNTLAHEIRHFYDKIKGHGGTKNDTYDEKTINKYNKFLYYISQTEQNAFYTGFKQKLNEDENFQKQLLSLFNAYNQEGNKTIEEVIKQFSEESYKYRLENCFINSDDLSNINEPDKPKDTDDKETKLNKTINIIRCHNPLLFWEYKYYILDTPEHFYEFISKNPKTKKEDNERKEEILSFLKPYNDDKPIETKEQLENVYNGIIKFYNGTFSSYMNLIKNFIKKHNG